MSTMGPRRQSFGHPSSSSPRYYTPDDPPAHNGKTPSIELEPLAQNLSFDDSYEASESYGMPLSSSQSGESGQDFDSHGSAMLGYEQQGETWMHQQGAEPRSRKARGSYKCRRCGQPKRGHVCPLENAPAGGYLRQQYSSLGIPNAPQAMPDNHYPSDASFLARRPRPPPQQPQTSDGTYGVSHLGLNEPQTMPSGNLGGPSAGVSAFRRRALEPQMNGLVEEEEDEPERRMGLNSLDPKHPRRGTGLGPTTPAFTSEGLSLFRENRGGQGQHHEGRARSIGKGPSPMQPHGPRQARGTCRSLSPSFAVPAARGPVKAGPATMASPQPQRHPRGRLPFSTSSYSYPNASPRTPRTQRSSPSPPPVMCLSPPPGTRAHASPLARSQKPTPKRTPQDVCMLIILSKLPPGDLMSASVCCKRWRRLSAEIWCHVEEAALVVREERTWAGYMPLVLAKCPRLLHLTLHCHVPLTDEALRLVYTGRPQLRTLVILSAPGTFCQVSRDGLAQLARSCQRLKSLYINGCNEMTSLAVKSSSLTTLALSACGGVNQSFLSCPNLLELSLDMLAPAPNAAAIGPVPTPTPTPTPARTRTPTPRKGGRGDGGTHARSPAGRKLLGRPQQEQQEQQQRTPVRALHRQPQPRRTPPVTPEPGQLGRHILTGGNVPDPSEENPDEGLRPGRRTRTRTAASSHLLMAAEEEEVEEEVEEEPEEEEESDEDWLSDDEHPAERPVTEILYQVSTSCHSLERLHVASPCVGLRSVQALMDGQLQQSLRALSLTFSPLLCDEGVAVICQGGLDLELLDLSGCSRLTDTCLQHISRGFGHVLTRLLVAACPLITPGGMQAVIEGLPHLQLLDCGHSLVSQEQEQQQQDSVHPPGGSQVAAASEANMWQVSGEPGARRSLKRDAEAMSLDDAEVDEADGYLVHQVSDAEEPDHAGLEQLPKPEPGADTKLGTGPGGCAAAGTVESGEGTVCPHVAAAEEEPRVAGAPAWRKESRAGVQLFKRAKLEDGEAPGGDAEPARAATCRSPPALGIGDVGAGAHGQSELALSEVEAGASLAAEAATGGEALPEGGLTKEPLGGAEGAVKPLPPLGPEADGGALADETEAPGSSHVLPTSGEQELTLEQNCDGAAAFKEQEEAEERWRRSGDPQAGGLREGEEEEEGEGEEGERGGRAAGAREGARDNFGPQHEGGGGRGGEGAQDPLVAGESQLDESAMSAGVGSATGFSQDLLLLDPATAPPAPSEAPPLALSERRLLRSGIKLQVVRRALPELGWAATKVKLELQAGAAAPGLEEERAKEAREGGAAGGGSGGKEGTESGGEPVWGAERGAASEAPRAAAGAAAGAGPCREVPAVVVDGRRVLQISHPKLRKVSLWGCSALQGLLLECPQLQELNLTQCSRLVPRSETFFLECPAIREVHVGACPPAVVRSLKGLLPRRCSVRGEQ